MYCFFAKMKLMSDDVAQIFFRQYNIQIVSKTEPNKELQIGRVLK